MSVLLHTIEFDKWINFIDQTGISFVNTTTAETASSVVSVTTLPNKVASYDVTWSVDPIGTDVVEWRYDGTGNYKDVDNNLLLSQILIINTTL